MKWHEGRFEGFDLESTSTDPIEARTVTAAVVHVIPGDRPAPIQWLLDPGVDVPTEAAAVHGWTRPRILAEVGGEGRAIRLHNGRRTPMYVDGALGEIAGHLSVAMHTEVPVVIANAAYDVTLLEVELARHGIDTITARPSGIRGLVDPQVIEKAYDPYRKLCYKAPGCRPAEQHHECSGCRGGKVRCGGCGVHNKQLGSLCTHYGVRLTGAHNAGADALAAVRLAVKLAALWPEIARWRLPTLHAHQVTWRRDQANSLRAYFDKNHMEHDGVDPGWPVHTRLPERLAQLGTLIGAPA